MSYRRTVTEDRPRTPNDERRAGGTRGVPPSPPTRGVPPPRGAPHQRGGGTRSLLDGRARMDGGDSHKRVGAATMDPRMALRRAAVSRAAGRRRLKILLSVLLGLTLVGAAVAVAYSPLMRVRRLHVSVSGSVSRQAVVAASGIGRSSLMVSADPSAIERRLEALPWVASAKVKRVWPWSIDVAVTSRRAVGQVYLDGGHRASEAVDVTGRVLAVEKPPIVGLPALSGALHPAKVGSWLAQSQGAGAKLGSAPTMPPVHAYAAVPAGSTPLDWALHFLAALPASVRAQVTQFDLASDGKGALQLSSGAVQVRLGSNSQLAAKLQSLETVLAQVPLTGVKVVDLRVPGRPVLTKTGSTTTVSTTSRG